MEVLHSQLNVSNYCTVPAVDRLLIDMCAMLVCVDVLFCVVIWRAAECHYHFTLTFVITFISCIDDNECLHTITLMN